MCQTPKVTAPAISVVLPVRDGAAFISEAVRSILGQTWRDFELLAVDDGSRDATPTILGRLAAEDPRVRVLAQSPLGIVPALNRGVQAAAGRYVARMDADDLAAPERLALQAAVLEGDPAVAAVGSACRVIGLDGTILRVRCPPTRAAAVRAALERGNPMIHPTVLLRRQAMLAVGGYRPAFLLCEDYDLWLRLSERHDLVNLAQPLLDYREHPGQSTWWNLEQRMLSELGALAAARMRRAGLADPAGEAPITRAALGGLGLDEDAISDGIIDRALGTAIEARAAGHRAAARAALDLLRRQPTLGVRTRLHGALLRLSLLAR